MQAMRGYFLRLCVLCGAAALVLAGALPVVRSGAQTAPAAVPVTGEPHHHLAYSNANVRAFQVEVPPHLATLLHRHDADYIWLALGDADVVNAVAGQPETRLQVKDGTVHFTRGGFAHIARNESDTPFRNVTIELLQPQTNPRNLCDEVVSGMPMNCELRGNLERESTRAIARPEFETDQVRASLLRIQPKGRVSFASSKTRRLLIALDDARVEVPLMAGMVGSELAPSYGPITLHSGHVWLLSSETWTEQVRNKEKTAVRFLLLEFKDARP